MPPTDKTALFVAFALDLFVSLADRLRYSRSAKSNKFAFALDLFVSLHKITKQLYPYAQISNDSKRTAYGG
jgi:hypothetical protein